MQVSLSYEKQNKSFQSRVSVEVLPSNSFHRILSCVLPCRASDIEEFQALDQHKECASASCVQCDTQTFCLTEMRSMWNTNNLPHRAVIFKICRPACLYARACVELEVMPHGCKRICSWHLQLILWILRRRGRVTYVQTQSTQAVVYVLRNLKYPSQADHMITRAYPDEKWHTQEKGMKRDWFTNS